MKITFLDPTTKKRYDPKEDEFYYGLADYQIAVLGLELGCQVEIES